MSYLDILDIAAAVKRRRVALGFRQADLAERTGLSVGVIGSFEAGRSQTLSFVAVQRVLESVGLYLQMTDVVPTRPTFDELQTSNESERDADRLKGVRVRGRS